MEDPGRITTTRALGVDEHKVLNATKDHHSLYATSFLDVVTGQLLDVVRGRSADNVAYWLSQGTPAWRQRIEAVAIDPHAGYLKGILAALPDVTVTVDHFYAARVRHEAPSRRQRVRTRRSGLSQQPGEAEGSLTLEAQGRVGSSFDNDGTGQHCQMAWSSAQPSRTAPVPGSSRSTT